MQKQSYLAIFTMITFSVACNQVPQKVSDIELSDLVLPCIRQVILTPTPMGGGKRRSVAGDKSSTNL
jgi:hypothetical protein